MRKVKNREGLQTEWAERSHIQNVSTNIPKLETLMVSESLLQGLRLEFFGTKLDKQKSFFVFSMLVLIVSFFVLSAINLSLDILMGLIIVGFGLYGGIRWTRQLLGEMR
jgi:hypothetical protein